MAKPTATIGMRHIALYAENFEACENFYVNLLGMQVEWRPDVDNVYLTSGNDNLALHRATEKAQGPQRLDHIGFFLAKIEPFLLENLDPNEVDRTGIIPDKVMKGLANLGAFAIKVPEEYGGLGMSQVNYNRAIQMVASYCGSTAVLG